MNFFEPRLSYCIGNDGKMASEFPIIYYAAAILYKIFGEHDYFIRIINLLFFYSGLFFLFKTTSLVLEDKYYGLLTALMVFTSSIVIHYANNFLPDVPALSCSFIALYYVVLFTKQKQNKHLWKATLFFTLAGLLKVTLLAPYLAIIATVFCVYLFKIYGTDIRELKVHKNAIIGFILVPVLISAAWIVYVRYYNQANNNIYFLTQTLPIWNMDEGSVKSVWGMIDYYWRWQFMYRDFLNVIPFIFLVVLFIPYRRNLPLTMWLCMLVLACLSVQALFFQQLDVHDYYLISLIPVPVAICVVFLRKLRDWKEKWFNSVIVRVAVTVLLGAMIYQGHRMMIKREQEPGEYYSDFNKMEPVFEKAGVRPRDKVISAGDNSSGISLYFMRRRGWTNMWPCGHLSAADIENYIRQGASYLIISKNGELNLNDDAKEKFIKNKVGEIDDVKIYKL
jgi:hypothetical protein